MKAHRVLAEQTKSRAHSISKHAHPKLQFCHTEMVLIDSLQVFSKPVLFLMKMVS